MAARSHLKKDALAPVHKRMDRLSGVDVPVLIRTGSTGRLKTTWFHVSPGGIGM